MREGRKWVAKEAGAKLGWLPCRARAVAPGGLVPEASGGRKALGGAGEGDGRKFGYTIGAGYGKLKDGTIRIGHMGDHTVAEWKRCSAH